MTASSAVNDQKQGFVQEVHVYLAQLPDWEGCQRVPTRRDLFFWHNPECSGCAIVCVDLPLNPPPNDCHGFKHFPFGGGVNRGPPAFSF